MIQPRVRRRDGRRVYDVRLRDPSGKEYSRTFLTRRQAQAFEVSERTSRLSSSWIDSRLAKTPLATVAEDWLESDARKRARSIERDRGILANHVLPVLGSKPVGAISRADVRRLVRSWTGRSPASTVGRQYTTLRAVLAYAEASELIVRSPCRHIPLPQATPREAEILEAEGLERLAGAMGSYGPMIYLAALGLRWGKIAGLRVGRLDFLARRSLSPSSTPGETEAGWWSRSRRRPQAGAPSPSPIG
jgi:integrase